MKYTINDLPGMFAFVEESDRKRRNRINDLLEQKERLAHLLGMYLIKFSLSVLFHNAGLELMREILYSAECNSWGVCAYLFGSCVCLFFIYGFFFLGKLTMACGMTKKFSHNHGQPRNLQHTLIITKKV